MSASTFLEIDGSQGEGGGQILRSSMSLSAITGRPIRISEIRKKRPKPGLANQHLTAVRAAATVSRGHLTGDSVGSIELTFVPGPLPIEGGKFRFEIGSAGSGSLVLQTVLPILLMARTSSVVEICACGTHNPLAPPFEFLAECFLPQLKKMGCDVTIELGKHGFYPAGGGSLRAIINPFSAPLVSSLDVRGAAVNRAIIATVLNLPQSVAELQCTTARTKLGWKGSDCDSVRLKGAAGRGNYVMAKCEYENVCEITTGFADRGASDADVAKDAAEQMQKYLETDAPVGEHLADQLLLPMVLGAGGHFKTGIMSSHLSTNIDIINTFLGDLISLKEVGPSCFMVEVRPAEGLRAKSAPVSGGAGAVKT